MNKHVIKKKNIVLFALLVIISLLLIINLKNNGIIQFNNQNKSLAEQVAQAEARYDQEAGKKATVSSLKITERKTGVDAFDEDDEPGNDSRADNNIIRTLDMLSYTIEVGMNLKEGVSENIRVATIKIQATLPQNCEDKVRWDLASMPWADEGSSVTDNGLTFVGYYTMGANQVSIPGAQNLLLVAKVLYAKNGFEFLPSFSASLLGNEDVEAISIQDNDNVIVSATDKYDIALNCRSENNTILLDGQEGKLFGYAFAFILKGDNPDKGLRGIERPINDVSFDINYSLSREDNETRESTDITNNARFYNYKYNNNNAQTLGESKNSIEDIPYMDWSSWGWCPYSKLEDFYAIPRNTVYKNGNLEMVDNKNGIINVTISDWDISETFPDLDDQDGNHNENHHSFTEDYGYVSTGMFYIMVDVNDDTTMANTTVKLNVNINNVNIKKLSGEQFSKEVNLDNNEEHQNFKYTMNGHYSKSIMYTNANGDQLESVWGRGDASRYINKDVYVTNNIWVDGRNIEKNWVYGLDCLTKFDDKTLQLQKTSDKECIVRNTDTKNEILDLEYNVLYAVKEDGTGWESDDEMIRTTMDELEYYDTIEDLEKTGKTCIAVLIESKSGIIKSGKHISISVPFKVRNDATINSVVQALNDVRLYNKDNILDRNTKTHLLNKDKKAYEPISWSAENLAYVKAEYDKNGNIKEGTHSPGMDGGNSLKIVAGKLRVNIDSFQDNVQKDVYNMGNGENEVDYKMNIVLEKGDSINEEIEGVNVKATVKLPVGLTYKKGSSNKDEPEIINNDDGTTTLIWYEEDCSTNVNIEDITFTAYISETTENNTVYEISAVVLEEPNKDGIYKVGVDKIEDKITNKDSITVVNLSSYAFTKRRDEPSIEKNGMIHYILTFYNNLANEVVNFRLLDVLPYNGDDRGSNFKGTYTLDHVSIKGNKNPEDLQVYVTEDVALRDDGIDASSNNLRELFDWENVQTRSTNTQSTGILISGQLSEKQLITVDIYLQTKGNDPLDIYVNNATAMTETLQVPLESTNEEIVVVSRSIEGIVWFDQNRNGLKDMWEPYLENIAVSLATEDGEEVTDVLGKNVGEIKTDSSGSYKFTNLPKGKYKVKITVDNIFQITEKEVGDRTKVNSKFYPSTKETDVIDLTEENDTVLLKDYVNAGLISDTYEQTLGNIQATKTASPKNNSEVKKGSEITYKINIKNIGSESKTFLVKDKIPEGTSFKDQSIKINEQLETERTEKELTETGIELTLNAGDTATIEFIVTVTGEGLLNEENIITNSAEVDGKPTNEVKHKYYRKAKIDSEKRAAIENGEREYAKEGDTIKYEIEVTNDGDIDKIVNIKDAIPDGTEFVNDSIKINNEATTLTEEDLTEKGINIDVLPTSGETSRKLKIMKNPPTITNLNITTGTAAQKYFSDGKRINAIENDAISNIFTSYNAELWIDGEGINGHYYNTKGDNGENPIHYSIEFTVDCQEFLFGIKASHFRVYVDEGNGYEMTSYDGEDGIYEKNYYKMEFVTKKQRNIKLELNNKFYGVILHENDTLTKINKEVNEKVLFVGDGMAYTSALNQMGYKSYVNVISDILGLEMMNQSADSIGYIADNSGNSYIFKEKLENLVPKLQPDVVILQGGRHDISSGNTVENTMTKANECIQWLKDNHPDVKIILIGVWTGRAPEYTSDAEIKRKELNTQLREKALENNIPYIDLIAGETITGDGKIITKVGPYITADNVSIYTNNKDLTIEGHKYMGEKLAEEVYKILNDIQAEEISPVTLSFEVKVKNLDEGVYSKTIKNIATINEENTNTERTEVKKPHIVATKKAEPEGGNVNKGQEITYTIELNDTEGTTDGTAIVKDKIPKGTSFKDQSIKINGEQTDKTEQDLTETGIEVNLNGQETATIEFTVIVTGEGLLNEENIIINSAEVNGKPTNEVEHKYYRKAEINSEKRATIENEEREYVKEGDTIKYEIEVTNDGNIDKIVNIKDAIPDGTEFVDKSIKINNESTTLTEEDLTGKGINIDVLPTSGETSRKLKIMKNPPTITNLNIPTGAVAQSYFSDGKRINAIENGAINKMFTSYNAELWIDDNEAINGHYYNTKGYDGENPIQYSIEFTVDCQEFLFGIKTNHFRVYVDEGNGYEMTSYDGTEGINIKNYYKMEFATKKQRNIKLELNNKFYGVILHENDTLTEIDREVNEKVLFIGDGMAYTSALDQMGYKSYVNVISDILGSEVINQSGDGIGYIADNDGKRYNFKERLETLVPKLEPDVVILQGGRQDLSRGYTVDDTMKNADECIKLLKEKYPDVKIILIGVFTGHEPEYTSDTEPDRKELNTQLRKKALDNNIPYIDLIAGETITGDGKIITKVKQYITTENVKDYVSNSDLTIKGHEYMGEKLAEEVYKILNDIQAEKISSVTLSFEVKVKNLDKGVYSKTITNTATVNEEDTNTEQTEVKKPHIVATKKAEPEGGNVKKGQEITYTIELNNTEGTIDGTAIVKDTLPEGVIFNGTTLSIIKDGEEETHSIEEFKTNGIEVTVPAGKKVDVKFKVTVTGEGLENNQEIENTAKVNENPTNSVTHKYLEEDKIVNIKVIKKWEDNNNQKGERPQSVKIQLYADGVLTEQEEVTGTEDSNQWEYTFTNLNKYDEEGNEIEYRIDEEELENGDYTKTSVTNQLVETEEGYEGTIVNTIKEKEPERTGSLKITKMARTKEEADAGEKGKPLAGVEFRIYRVEDDSTDLTVPDKYADAKERDYQEPEGDDKWYTKALETGKNGTIKFDDLPLGRYLVEEVRAPDYIVGKIPNFIVDIPLTKEDSTLLYDVEIIPKNEVVYGDITLTKEGPNGEKLTGVTFKLQRKEGEEKWVDYPNSEECNTLTDREGTITVGALPTGTYRFVEMGLGVNEGYILDNKHGYEFTVSMDNATKQATVNPSEIKVVNDKPTVEKTVESYVRDSENNNTVKGNQDGNKSFDKGDTVTYKVVVDIPSEIADLNIFNISDTMDSNLSYKEGTVKVKAYKKSEDEIEAPETEMDLIEDTDYTITLDDENGRTWLLDFNKECKQKLTGYYKLEITYEAIVLGTEKTGEGYNNNVKLNYSTKVDVDIDGNPNKDETKESQDEETVYTGGFRIEKRENSEEGTKLIGAKFKIAGSKEDAKSKKFIKDENGQEIEITSNEIGLAEYWGLSYGTYYLVEVQAPTGYNLLHEPVKFTIDEKSYKAGNELVIINRKGFELPATGGKGTLIFTIGGLILIIVGVALYKKNRIEN